MGARARAHDGGAALVDDEHIAAAGAAPRRGHLRLHAKRNLPLRLLPLQVDVEAAVDLAHPHRVITALVLAFAAAQLVPAPRPPRRPPPAAEAHPKSVRGHLLPEGHAELHVLQLHLARLGANLDGQVDPSVVLGARRAAPRERRRLRPAAPRPSLRFPSHAGGGAVRERDRPARPPLHLHLLHLRTHRNRRREQLGAFHRDLLGKAQRADGERSLKSKVHFRRLVELAAARLRGDRRDAGRRALVDAGARVHPRDARERAELVVRRGHRRGVDREPERPERAERRDRGGHRGLQRR